MAKIKNNYCNEHDIQFENAFELARHRAEEHTHHLEWGGDVPILEKEIYVIIKTTRPVEYSLGSVFWTNVKELRVKQEMSSDVIRVLTDAYGEGVVEGVEMDIVDK